MAETICEASKPRSHKLTRGLSILRRRLLSSCNHNDGNYYQDQWGGSSNNDLDNGKPESKVILSNVEASRVEFVNSSVDQDVSDISAGKTSPFFLFSISYKNQKQLAYIARMLKFKLQIFPCREMH